MKPRFLALFAVLSLLAAAPAHAMDLHQARSSGLVGEQLDGYVAALKPSGDIDALVADINAKRKAEYARIAQEKGQPVDVVAKLAAQEIINKLDSGSSYQAPNGSWKKR